MAGLGRRRGLRAVRQVVTNLKPAIQFLTKGPATKGVSFLGRVAGPMAIVTGGFTLATSLPEAYNKFQEGDKRMGWAHALSAISGGLAVIGGIALLVPGAQPLAAVFLGASAIAGAASVAVEYWPTSTRAATPADTPQRTPTPAPKNPDIGGN